MFKKIIAATTTAAALIAGGLLIPTAADAAIMQPKINVCQTVKYTVTVTHKVTPCINWLPGTIIQCTYTTKETRTKIVCSR